MVESGPARESRQRRERTKDATLMRDIVPHKSNDSGDFNPFHHYICDITYLIYKNDHTRP